MGGHVTKHQPRDVREIDGDIDPAKAKRGDEAAGCKTPSVANDIKYLTLDKMFAVEQGGVALLLIDPQVDFHPGGSLAVEGANEDTERLCQLIKKHSDLISQITVTLDSHHRLHISNQSYWVNPAGTAHPPPFTCISVADLESKKWVPIRPDLMDHSMAYLKALEDGKQYSHLIWPDHCLIGTVGQTVQPDLNEALQEWALKKRDIVNYVHKGENCCTEMFSVFEAAAPLQGHPRHANTMFNVKLLDRLLESDRVLIGGQALSHCVNFSVRDLLSRWPKERRKDLYMLSDASSSVKGFEKNGEEFLDYLRSVGCNVVTCDEAISLVFRE